MAAHFTFPSFKAQVSFMSFMSSANRAEVPGGRGLASMVSKLETTAYGSSFSIQDKAASISVPDFLRIDQRIF